VKLFKQGVLSADNKTITIDSAMYEAVCGKHCVWIPELEAKIIWSHNGKIEALRDWDKGRNRDQLLSGTFNEGCVGYDKTTLQSIVEEYALMRALSEQRMAPPVGEIFYIKRFTARYLRGAMHCDPKGRYGYFVKDASKLKEPGEFTIDRFMQQFVTPGVVAVSTGAVGDLKKPNNTINGYLVDVRRTIWDNIAYRVDNLPTEVEKIQYREDCEALKDRIHSLTQFPHKQRRENYQSYLLDDDYVEGSRNTLYRMNQMGIGLDLSGRTVLDLGCNLGAICFEAYQRGARNISGLDYEVDYINCAIDLARHNGFQINFQRMDLMGTDVVPYINGYYADEPIDIVFALSLYKHVSASLWKTLSNIKWKKCYVESNNVGDRGYDSDHAREMERGMKALGVAVERIGLTEDRSPRALWKLTRG